LADFSFLRNQKTTPAALADSLLSPGTMDQEKKAPILLPIQQAVPRLLRLALVGSSPLGADRKRFLAS